MAAPLPANSQRDLRTGRAQPRRGSPPGGRQAGVRGRGGCGAAVLPTEQRDAAVPPRTQKSEAYLPALCAASRSGPITARTEPRRFHSFAAQRFRLPRPWERDPASYQRASCSTALLRPYLPRPGSPAVPITAFPTRAARSFLPAAICAAPQAACITGAGESKGRAAAAAAARGGHGHGVGRAAPLTPTCPTCPPHSQSPQRTHRCGSAPQSGAHCAVRKLFLFCFCGIGGTLHISTRDVDRVGSGRNQCQLLCKPFLVSEEAFRTVPFG